MAKEQTLECPSCNGTVALGEVKCPHCGVNLKSGESFEVQVKRARGKAKHKEIYTGGLYVGIALALAVCIFAGYEYQRSVEKVLADQSNTFMPFLQKFQQVRDLADAGQYAQARTDGQDLLKELQAADDAIVLTPYDATKVTDVYSQSRVPRKSKGDQAGKKRLLANMIAKTKYLLDNLPT